MLSYKVNSWWTLLETAVDKTVSPSHLAVLELSIISHDLHQQMEFAQAETYMFFWAPLMFFFILEDVFLFLFLKSKLNPTCNYFTNHFLNIFLNVVYLYTYFYA